MPGIALSLLDLAETPAPPSAVGLVDVTPLRKRDPVEVNGHRLKALLGSGGTADVYYALAPDGGPVVLKLFKSERGNAAASRREYRMARMIDADCTTPALGQGVSPVGAYLVTTFLPGYRSGTKGYVDAMPVRRLWTIAAGLARVLAAVHARGVVHCDVKPSNLLIDRDDVRLIDFGIARLAGEPEPFPGIARGSRGWAAPEQLHALPAAPAMDVFAWGCVVAHLAGGRPYGDDTDTWHERVGTERPDLTGIPAGLAELVGWALSRDPAHRPTAEDLARAIRRALADAPVPVQSTMVSARSLAAAMWIRFSKRRRVMWWSAFGSRSGAAVSRDAGTTARSPQEVPDDSAASLVSSTSRAVVHRADPPVSR